MSGRVRTEQLKVIVDSVVISDYIIIFNQCARCIYDINI